MFGVNLPFNIDIMSACSYHICNITIYENNDEYKCMLEYICKMDLVFENVMYGEKVIRKKTYDLGVVESDNGFNLYVRNYKTRETKTITETSMDKIRGHFFKYP